MENNTATSEYNLEENDELYQCVDPKEIFGQEILLKANLSTFIDGNQNTAHEITSKGEQVEDSSRTWLDFNLVDPPKKTCKNDRLFLEAKQHNPPKKIVPFGSMLTIMGSREYIQCMNKGRKICQKNQKIVDFAMANNKQVRSNRGRYLTIAGEQEYEDQKIRNLINTHEHRKNL